MWEYQNGNYTVRITDDGTKTRITKSGGDTPVPEIPESMDVKITNKCDGGCPWCHEGSTPDGAHFDVDDAVRLFEPLPDGVELAVGGGNPLTRWMDLSYLERKVGCIINATVNAKHLIDVDLYTFCPKAIGISYAPNRHEAIRDITKKWTEDYVYYPPQTVIHLIAGVHTLEDMERCVKDFDRILVLGYKDWGRGKAFNSDGKASERVKEWTDGIGGFMGMRKTIAFDNLAVEQLDMKRFFTPEKWKEVYMGSDGQFSMYLDLVKMEYAPSSFSPTRKPIGGMTVKEMFADVRKG